MRKLITLRSFLGVIIVGSLGGVAIVAWLTLASPPVKETSSQEIEIGADLKLDRVHYTETREGVKEWEMEAASAVYFKGENTILLDHVRAVFYGKDKERYVLVGEKGKFHTQSKMIEVYDGVKIDSSGGYHLRTERLKYEAEQRKLTTSDPVEMNGPDLQVEGVGMVVDLNLQRLRVLGGVTSTFSPLFMKKPTKAAM
jgi:LPS export ABC transporter protein LptC